MLRDMPLDELRRYTSSVLLPEDFDEFWADTLAASRAGWFEPRLEVAEVGLVAIDIYDLTFAGFAGEPIKGWVRLPHGAAGPLGAVVTYAGYGGGRGLPTENLLWAAAGFVHVEMDSRGQGSSWSAGATPDAGWSGPAVPGFCTRGIDDKATYYYRRLFTDAVMAVDAARALPQVDPARVGVMGTSQGGAMALAAARLGRGVSAAWCVVPFLADVRRGLEVTDERPFAEFTAYLACHRNRAEHLFEVLAYFDGVNLARGARVPAQFTVALMDNIVPPSTVFAAYNTYAGPKDLTIWPFNNHEAGGPHGEAAAIAFFNNHLKRTP
ncbi:MAG: acetylxylan esterase [Bifidobacteriaceae bacterium]|nr:acetylxylan esterase [Bifidobacteriaceae bacterium]